MQNEAVIPFPVLKTLRLVLRQLVARDAKEIFLLRSDEQVNKYLNRPIAAGIIDARNFIMAINELHGKNELFYWAITLKEENKLLGTICLFNFSAENKTSEIGYELLPLAQGNGIMSESLEAVIGYAFHTVKIERVNACSHEENKGSLGLLKRRSFKDSGIRDESNPHLKYYHLKNPEFGGERESPEINII